ncbi:MAG: hypothetical protein HWN67_20350 [Candidatus Helarchaeota archaeon]|nr:hypothetical protein [Candidatus Helarchaeota archaeon]
MEEKHRITVCNWTCFKVIKVIITNTSEVIYIDPQGHKFARNIRFRKDWRGRVIQRT